MLDVSATVLAGEPLLIATSTRKGLLHLLHQMLERKLRILRISYYLEIWKFDINLNFRKLEFDVLKI